MSTRQKKTSIGTWAYIWGGYQEDPVPLKTVLEKVSSLGFDGIEFAAFPPHLEPNTRKKRTEIKEMFNHYGLEVSAVAAPFPSPTTSKKNEYLDAIKSNLEICLDLDIPKLRVDTVDPPTAIPRGMDYETCFAKVAEVWNNAADICQKSQVKLIWEFEPGFLFNKPSEIVRMVYKVDHTNFSILFDTCHAHMCSVVGSRQLGKKETLDGGVIQFAHMLTGKIGHLHFIDSDETLHDNETSTHAPLGTGVLNFDKIIPAVLEAGYSDDWWSIDLCFWPNALYLTEENKRYLDKLISKFT